MTSGDPVWIGDVNDAAVDAWTAETTPFERVKQTLLSTTTYQYAGGIPERARVSEPSARKHLRALADAGFAERDATGQGTRFKRSRETIAMQRITDIHSELSRDELVSGIRDVKSRISAYRDRYDATEPDDLAVEFDAADD